MLVSLVDMLSWLDIETEEIVITANNSALYFKYDSGSSTLCTLTEATYTGDSMATHLKSVLDTALTASLTITYSANKFTITEAAHTIQFINSGSTAGYDIGFTADSTASVSITSDKSVGDPSDLVSTILTSTDKYVKEYCRRVFESASYSEIYNGGVSSIFLNEYPITALSRIANGRDESFSVNNTNTTSYATCSCNGTNFTCNLNGSDSDLALGTYTTITTLVAAINDLGSGWVATVSGDYGDYLSSEIISFYGKSCLDNDIAYVEIPSESLTDFIIDTDTGEIKHNFPVGFQNIFVNYTAGYSTIPTDLQMAVKILVQYIYNKVEEDNLGNEYYSLGDVKKALTNEFPIEVQKILMSYKRFMV